MPPIVGCLIAVLFVGAIGIGAVLYGFWLKKHGKLCYNAGSRN